MLPQVGIITDIRRETPDVKTFRIVRPDGTKLFEHMPGQCAMLCVPGVGEALFSITSSPTNKEYQEFSIKECGTLTNYLHNMSVGDEILVRGPYGNHFPVETVLKGQDLLFIAGGIGLAPLRSVINYVLDNRDNYGTVDIVYGSRSKDDLVQLKEIQEVWAKAKDVNVHLTIDREQEGWDGHVGFVPNYVKELNMSVDKTALICGPPIMIKFVLQGLQELGYEKTQVYTTLELRMKCGIGKVNAAAGTVELIRNFHPDCIISTGVAGGIDSGLKVMDVVAGSQIVYHDVWCGEGNAYGQIQGLPALFEGNDTLFNCAMSLDTETAIHGGLICSGDKFITDRQELNSIKTAFPAGLAVDMESGAIAQICHIYKVPFLSFRIISDTPGADNHWEQYTNFWSTIADRSFEVTRIFLHSLPANL